MIIGLTGTYCAGKNFISGILEKKGLAVLDVDKLGHKAIESEKEIILERFGKTILRPDGSIDRKLLGALVFGKPKELEALEAIIHPAVNRETSAWIESQHKHCVINAALLHYSSAFPVLEALIVVEAPVLTRLFRAKKRDGLSWKALIKRFNSQKKFPSQYFRERTDIYRVKNSFFFGSAFFRCFGMKFIKKPEERLEDRISEILSCLGCVKS